MQEVRKDRSRRARGIRVRHDDGILCRVGVHEALSCEANRWLEDSLCRHDQSLCHRTPSQCPSLPAKEKVLPRVTAFRP